MSDNDYLPTSHELHTNAILGLISSLLTLMITPRALYLYYQYARVDPILRIHYNHMTAMIVMVRFFQSLMHAIVSILTIQEKMTPTSCNISGSVEQFCNVSSNFLFMAFTIFVLFSRYRMKKVFLVSVILCFVMSAVILGIVWGVLGAESDIQGNGKPVSYFRQEQFAWCQLPDADDSKTPFASPTATPTPSSSFLSSVGKSKFKFVTLNDRIRSGDNVVLSVDSSPSPSDPTLKSTPLWEQHQKTHIFSSHQPPYHPSYAELNLWASYIFGVASRIIGLGSYCKLRYDAKLDHHYWDHQHAVITYRFFATIGFLFLMYLLEGVHSFISGGERRKFLTALASIIYPFVGAWNAGVWLYTERLAVFYWKFPLFSSLGEGTTVRLARNRGEGGEQQGTSPSSSPPEITITKSPTINNYSIVETSQMGEEEQRPPEADDDKKEKERGGRHQPKTTTKTENTFLLSNRFDERENHEDAPDGPLPVLTPRAHHSFSAIIVQIRGTNLIDERIRCSSVSGRRFILPTQGGGEGVSADDYQSSFVVLHTANQHHQHISQEQNSTTTSNYFSSTTNSQSFLPQRQQSTDTNSPTRTPTKGSQPLTRHSLQH